MWLGAFRHESCRDAEWYAEAEQEYRWRVHNAEEQLGPRQILTASHTLNLARLLHEQGKFDEALPIYRLALERWSSLPTDVGARRTAAIAMIEQEIEHCRNRQESTAEEPGVIFQDLSAD